jgi:hypothetical protein
VAISFVEFTESFEVCISAFWSASFKWKLDGFKNSNLLVHQGFIKEFTSLELTAITVLLFNPISHGCFCFIQTFSIEAGNSIGSIMNESVHLLQSLGVGHYRRSHLVCTFLADPLIVIFIIVSFFPELVVLF